MTSSPEQPSQQPSQQPNPTSQDLHWLGAGLIFVAEVLTLLALAWWGFTAIHGPVQVLVGLGLPIAVALLWGAYLAPRARHELPELWRLVLRTLVLALGGLALLAVGATVLGWIQLVCVALGTFLTLRWPAAQGVSRQA